MEQPIVADAAAIGVELAAHRGDAGATGRFVRDTAGAAIADKPFVNAFLRK